MHRSTQVLAGATVPGLAVERLVLAWLGARVGATSTARQGATPGRKQATSNQQPAWTMDGTRRGKRRGGAPVWDWTGVDSQDFGAAAGCASAHFGVAHGASKVVPVRLEVSHG